MEEQFKSQLAHIEVQSNNPFDLFKKWYSEAKDYSPMADVLSFATSSKDGFVTNRSLLLRKLEDDGFLLMTDRRSLKSAQILENNRCAAVFAWCYNKGETFLMRQARIEGKVEELSYEKSYRELYDPEPFYCKIRANLCHQGKEIEWTEHKERHDQLVTKYQAAGGIKTMPDHQIGYKIIPHVIEFYSAEDNEIADRVQFRRKSQNDEWICVHIAA